MSIPVLGSSDKLLYKQIGLCFDDDDQYIKERVESTELSSSALNARESVLRFIQSTEEAAMGVPHLQPSEPSESTESPSAPRKAKKQAQKRLNEAHDSAVEESFTSDSSITDDETEEESPVTAIRALFE